MMDKDRDRNRDVHLNYGLITRGKLKDIERLQQVIEDLGLLVVYHTVTDKRLKLVKFDGESLNGKRKSS